MQKNKSLTLAFLVVALFLSYAAATVYATHPTGIYVNPGTITTPGQSTNITLVTPRAATGTLNVTCVASGNSWTRPINTAWNGTDYTQAWTFPTDFSGANTNTLGLYDVVANLTMSVGRFVWKTEFEVQFFVVPDLPLGTLMAVVACFGAIVGYKKLRQ